MITVEELAHDVLTETLHGTPPMRTVAALAEGVLDLADRLKKTEAQRDEAVKALRETAESLCKCRRVMMEAIKDFHGKSVLFSSSFLIIAEDLEKPERIP